MEPGHMVVESIILCCLSDIPIFQFFVGYFKQDSSPFWGKNFFCKNLSGIYLSFIINPGVVGSHWRMSNSWISCLNFCCKTITWPLCWGHTGDKQEKKQGDQLGQSVLLKLICGEGPCTLIMYNKMDIVAVSVKLL